MREFPTDTRAENDPMSRIRGGHCIVLGFGVSNRPLVPWLLRHGAGFVTVRDKRTWDDLSEYEKSILKQPGTAFVGGPCYLEGLADETASHPGTVLFRSPGFRPDTAQIADAVRAGGLLTSEMELFLTLTPARVLGVTGSDGKTTSTTVTSLLVSALLSEQGRGRMFLGGNIGTPLLPLVDDMTADDIAVLELSSFQLMTVTRSPECAAVTNLSPNHLDWHTGMDEYLAAKTNILSHAPCRMAVLNADNQPTVGVGLDRPDDFPVIWFSSHRNGGDGVVPAERQARGCPDGAVYLSDGRIAYAASRDAVPVTLLETERILVPGLHNKENFMTALALCLGIASPDALARTAGGVADGFRGVPHRLELVRRKDGVTFYNSSIDSSPSRTCAALAAMEEMNGEKCRREGSVPPKPILICGGRDKHVSFDPLAEALCRGARAVVLTGEARGQILDALRRCPAYAPEVLPTVTVPDWDEAMLTACRMARPGDTVLLSPACTSFDAFKNFEARGERFREIVNQLQ